MDHRVAKGCERATGVMQADVPSMGYRSKTSCLPTALRRCSSTPASCKNGASLTRSYSLNVRLWARSSRGLEEHRPDGHGTLDSGLHLERIEASSEHEARHDPIARDRTDLVQALHLLPGLLLLLGAERDTRLLQLDDDALSTPTSPMSSRIAL